jgi:cytochrome P450
VCISITERARLIESPDIYQNERILKSSAFLITQAAPGVFNLFNVVDTDLHRVKRRIVGHGLSAGATRRFEPALHEQVDIFLSRLRKVTETGETVNMTEVCKMLGFAVSLQLGFGQSLDLQESEENRWIVDAIGTSLWRLNIYFQWPSLKRLNVEKVLLPILLPKMLRYYRLVKSMIAKRKSESKSARPDLFSFISDYVDPQTGQGLSLKELWSEATFFLPAGGDTTSTLMAAVFFYLSRYPDVRAKLTKEIRHTFKSSREIASGPTLSGCIYLRACIEEALRISPPGGTTLWRDIPCDGQGPALIDGHAVPEGTRVGVNIYAIHHNETYFPDPWVYKPERFLSETEKELMGVAFTPFSIGYRSCAGKSLAYLETSVVIARTVWEFDFEKVGNIGGEKVFEMLDQTGSVHTGPVLRFWKRDGAATAE